MPSQLFSSLRIRELEIKNRIFVSPMCQYSAVEGVPQDWHFVHLGSRAVGGAGLVIAEATGVSAVGRISPGDTGIWNDAQEQAWKRIAGFIEQNGSIPAIQLAHAGRKASTGVPWSGKHGLSAEEGGWEAVAPSAIPFSSTYPMPRALSEKEIEEIIEQFGQAAERAQRAGFQIVEIHMAHGYLLHEFLSPLSNQRTDRFGGSLENRMRFPLQVAQEVRRRWPQSWPVFVRISATDWVEGGWDLDQSIALCRELKQIGIDLIDASSGGLVPKAKIPVGPNYQVPFAEKIRKETDLLTGAVGLITTPEQAEALLQEGKADCVILARAMLRDPYWPLHAAKQLGVDVQWPVQYGAGKE